MAWKTVVAAALAILVLAGCGGGSDHAANQSKTGTTGKQTATTERRGEPDAGGGDEEGQQGLDAIPTEDRRAFVQIGVAISRLATGASMLTVKHLDRPRDRVVLERLLPQVGALQPRDPGLHKLRTMTLKALGNAIDARNNANISQRTGHALAAEASRLLKALQAYQRSSPAIGALLPD